MNSVDDIRIGSKGHRIILPKKVANQFADLLIEVRNDPNSYGDKFVAFVRDNVSTAVEDDAYEEVWEGLLQDNKVLLEGFRRFGGVGNTLNGSLKTLGAKFYLPIPIGPDWTDRFYKLLQINTEMLYMLSTFEVDPSNTEADSFIKTCKQVITERRYSWCEVLRNAFPNAKSPFDLDCRNVSIICDGTVQSWRWVDTSDAGSEGRGKEYHLDNKTRDLFSKMKSTATAPIRATKNYIGKHNELVDRIDQEIRNLNKIAQKTNHSLSSSNIKQNSTMLNTAMLSQFKKKEYRWLATNPGLDTVITYDDIKDLFEEVVQKICMMNPRLEAQRQDWIEQNSEEYKQKQLEEKQIEKEASQVTVEEIQEFEEESSKEGVSSNEEVSNTGDNVEEKEEVNNNNSSTNESDDNPKVKGNYNRIVTEYSLLQKLAPKLKTSFPPDKIPATPKAMSSSELAQFKSKEANWIIMSPGIADEDFKYEYLEGLFSDVIEKVCSKYPNLKESHNKWCTENKDKLDKIKKDEESFNSSVSETSLEEVQKFNTSSESRTPNGYTVHNTPINDGHGENGNILTPMRDTENYNPRINREAIEAERNADSKTSVLDAMTATSSDGSALKAAEEQKAKLQEEASNITPTERTNESRGTSVLDSMTGNAQDGSAVKQLSSNNSKLQEEASNITPRENTGEKKDVDMLNKMTNSSNDGSDAQQLQSNKSKLQEEVSQITPREKSESNTTSDMLNNMTAYVQGNTSGGNPLGEVKKQI